MRKIIELTKRHEKILVACFLALFILLRLPGIDRPLHQDEYKWPQIVNPANEGMGIVPHPPLSEFIYKTAGHVVGYDVHFRYVPLFFGTLNLLLLYIFMRLCYGKREAVIAALIWSVSYFSILASLMVDTDGEILPFFFLLGLIAYEKLKNAPTRTRGRWIALLVGACIGGILVKLSFILAIGAIVVDYLWSQKLRLTKVDMMRYGGYTLLGMIALALLLIAAPFIFPFFKLGSSLQYWEHFFKADRGWFQTAIQCVKAVLYASPLLLVPFFAPKNTFKPLRPFYFFLGFAFLFYIVIFDFSAGALDRYLQLIILPLTAFAATAIASIFGDEVEKPSETTKIYLLAGCAAALAISLLQFMPQYIPPLHPKSDWVHRILTLKWSFVFPFHGGSGPLGFYVSFLYIGVSWLVCTLLLVAARRKPSARKHLLAFFIPFVLMYNLVFIEEYHFGIINGSAPKLLAGAVEFMKNDPDISQVLTYNDNGGAELQAIGKYQGRLYIAPMFGTDKTIKGANAHYFELDVPHPPRGPYEEYFAKCNIIYKKTDQKMAATVYDCREKDTKN
jgi:hypothetical protein